MAILATIVVGLVVGLLARFFMPGRDPIGIILTILLGIVGAWFGSWVGQVMGMYQEGEPAGWIMSIIGAMIVLFLFRMLAPRYT